MRGPNFTPVPAFSDNYIWMLERAGAVAVVDPGDAQPVRAALEAGSLRLAAILVTHHHPDHVGGLAALAGPGVPVFGPAAESATIGRLTRRLADGDRVRLEALDLELEVWAVPGHTLGHIAYVGRGFVLCGDTLFSAGCGRLFEGTAAQLHASLQRLARLPGETAVYCTHEYTRANLAFASAVEPDNSDVREAVREVAGLRARGVPTLPSTIARERRINPFLRAGLEPVRRAAERHAGRRLGPEVEVFAELRRWKDGFRAPAPA